jgi:hypothetical protein
VKTYRRTTMAVAVIAYGFSLLASLAFSATSAKPAKKRIAFTGTAYSSIDGRTTITIISSDELETATDGANLVAKYTRQGDLIRAVTTTFGTTQAIYYRLTAEGLQDAEGRMFYNTSALIAARKQAALTRFTMASIRSIAAACEAYAMDHGRYPGASSTKALADLITPTYVNGGNMTVRIDGRPLYSDGWGHLFEYRVSPDGRHYRVISGGADGRVDAVSRQIGSSAGGVMPSLAADIIFEDGQVDFIQYPAKELWSVP